MIIQKRSTLKRSTLKQWVTELKTPLAKTFTLTFVHARPVHKKDSKMIRLTCFDFHEAFDPQLEFERIRNCLDLPSLSIQTRMDETKRRIAPHTLHLLIPAEELEEVLEYPKLLATIGYHCAIDKGDLKLFINKRKPVRSWDKAQVSEDEFTDVPSLQS